MSLDLLGASRVRLLEILKERSYEEREVTLASGKKSNFYVDCKQTSLDGEGHVLIGRLFYAALVEHERITGVRHTGAGGLTLGADPIASAVSMTAALAGRSLPAFIVRKEAKGHGTGAYLEGLKNLEPGGALVILEDVVTTGGSADKAITRVRDAGFTTGLVLAIVDRLEGGREALESRGVKLISLFTRADFTDR